MKNNDPAHTSSDDRGRIEAKAIAHNLSLADKLAYSTARIECTYKDNAVGFGTAFFVDFVVRGSDHIPIIVTNKHVIADADVGRLRLHGVDALGNFSPAEGMWLELGNFSQAWINHPDPDVDLCVRPMGQFIRGAAGAQQCPAAGQISMLGIASDDDAKRLTTVEDVLMVGYPDGIWDETNGLPIIRRGVTATHCATDFRGRREFLLDISAIPGSSGSPVMRYDKASPLPNPQNVGMKLLGILSQCFAYDAHGDARTVPIPTTQAQIATGFIPINLGIAIRASRLFDFAEELDRRTGPTKE